MRSSVTTFLNDPWYELSQHIVLSKHFAQMFPLLTEMTAGDDESVVVVRFRSFSNSHVLTVFEVY